MRVERTGVSTSRKLRQLGDIHRNPPRLNRACEQFRRRSPPRFILEIDVGERLTVGVRATKMRLGLPARAAFY
jgi:hypothetical protein